MGQILICTSSIRSFEAGRVIPLPHKLHDDAAGGREQPSPPGGAPRPQPAADNILPLPIPPRAGGQGSFPSEAEELQRVRGLVRGALRARRHGEAARASRLLVSILAT